MELNLYALVRLHIVHRDCFMVRFNFRRSSDVTDIKGGGGGNVAADPDSRVQDSRKWAAKWSLQMKIYF